MGYAHRQELDTDIIYGAHGVSVSGVQVAGRGDTRSGGV
jgi:hypothetical protein